MGLSHPRRVELGPGSYDKQRLLIRSTAWPQVEAKGGTAEGEIWSGMVWYTSSSLT
jgi:hypothetical protein